jgi:DNA invertase Pin-like site-specific DNA recombinase
MYLAHPYALTPAGVAVPFTIDDAFYDDLGASLPDCSVAFLNRAGSWSARNSRSGFVPSSMLARFTDDPDLVMRTLLAAGIIKRVKGGVRIIAGLGLVVVNASDAAERVTRDKEEADRNRAEWRERKSRQREAAKAERQEKIAAGVPPMSRGTTADVTREQTEIRKKPQVKGSHVTRDIGVTSRGTSRPSHARADFDSDFDLNPDQVSRSGVVNAGACEPGPPPGSPAFRLQVIAAFAEATRTEIDDRTAGALAAEVLGKATEPVPNPLGYVLKSIAKERDPCGRWLPRRPARTAFAEPLPHCGDRLCSPSTRRREDPETGADDGPCPKCSGSAATWKAS